MAKRGTTPIKERKYVGTRPVPRSKTARAVYLIGLALMLAIPFMLMVLLNVSP